jgi:hypothetical protein
VVVSRVGDHYSESVKQVYLVLNVETNEKKILKLFTLEESDDFLIETRNNHLLPDHSSFLVKM